MLIWSNVLKRKIWPAVGFCQYNCIFIDSNWSQNDQEEIFITIFDELFFNNNFNSFQIFTLETQQIALFGSICPRLRTEQNTDQQCDFCQVMFSFGFYCFRHELQYYFRYVQTDKHKKHKYNEWMWENEIAFLSVFIWAQNETIWETLNILPFLILITMHQLNNKIHDLNLCSLDSF
jgi:hypothetical protein